MNTSTYSLRYDSNNGTYYALVVTTGEALRYFDGHPSLDSAEAAAREWITANSQFQG